MKFKINFTIDGVDDYIVVEEETTEEVREVAMKWFISRGLDFTKCNVWSEEL